MSKLDDEDMTALTNMVNTVVSTVVTSVVTSAVAESEARMTAKMATKDDLQASERRLKQHVSAEIAASQEYIVDNANQIFEQRVKNLDEVEVRLRGATLTSKILKVLK